MKLQELSQRLISEGFDNELQGDPEIELTAANTLDDAISGEISFLSNPKYKDKLTETNASVVIVSYDDVIPPGLSVIKCNNPYGALTAAIIHIHGHRIHPQWDIDERAVIDATASIGSNANIAANVYIAAGVVIGANVTVYPGCYIADNVVIGDDVTLFPNVVIYDDSVLGNRITLHSGTIIGQDGLGYSKVDGQWLKIPQAGHALIEDDVEMGANCAVDRATLGQTKVCKGSKFSDLVVIGHGTKVGERSMLVAQVGIAGSVDVGKDVTMGGQVGVSGHISIGDNVTIGAKSAVWSSIESNTHALGYPAIATFRYRKQMVHVQQLPKLKKQIKAMQKQIDLLQQKLEQLSQ
jgi:UDP-3-O-[3-hydroxymyristoyl] glucosamine N-acyltransferase